MFLWLLPHLRTKVSAIHKVLQLQVLLRNPKCDVLSLLESSEAVTWCLSFLSCAAAPTPSIRNTSSLGHKHPFATDHHCAISLLAGTLLLIGPDVSFGHGCPPGTSMGTWETERTRAAWCSLQLSPFVCYIVREIPNQPCFFPMCYGRKSTIKSRDVTWTTSSIRKNHQTHCLPLINGNITKGPFLIFMDKPSKCLAVCHPERSHAGVRFCSSACSDLSHSKEATQYPGCQRPEKLIQYCFR